MGAPPNSDHTAQPILHLLLYMIGISIIILISIVVLLALIKHPVLPLPIGFRQQLHLLHQLPFHAMREFMGK